MAAPKPLTAGERLRAVADEFYQLAEQFDIESRTMSRLQSLHDQVEEACEDARAVVRGRRQRQT